jgi:hypothetical protein
MCREMECKKCEYAEDLKGCAAKHVGDARRRFPKGDPKGADLELSYLEKHLKEWSYIDRSIDTCLRFKN